MPHRARRLLPGGMFDDSGDMVVQQCMSTVVEMTSVSSDRHPPASAYIGPVDTKEFRAEVSRVFGASFVMDSTKMEMVTRVARDFRIQGAKLLSAAVQMGLTLIELHSQVGAENFSRAVRESRMIFCGWSASNLTKMMAVAQFVEAGRYDIQQLPQNWSTVYEFTTLRPQHLQRAMEGDLVRPDVTRSQVVAFKRQLLDAPHAALVSIDPLSRKLTTLRKSLANIDSRASRLKDARRKLVNEITAVERQIKGDLV